MAQKLRPSVRFDKPLFEQLATLRNLTLPRLTVLSEEPIDLKTEDGAVLGATLFSRGNSLQPFAVAVINGGAGIPQFLYWRFARSLASAGIATFTYDYRGIGRSRPTGSLRGFPASVEEWGSKDCAEVLRTSRSMFPGLPIVVVGHSIGLFLTGFVKDPSSVSLFVGISSHTGYWRDYGTKLKYPMAFMWHVLMPAVTIIFGYFPGRMVGLPEDLPKQVALEWARRKQPNFGWNLRDSAGRPDISRVSELLARFAGFRVPMLNVRIDDDPFSTSSAIRRVQELFGNCSHQVLAIDSNARRRLGHFGYFRTDQTDRWQLIIEWVRTQTFNDRQATIRENSVQSL